jgi:putative transposase
MAMAQREKQAEVTLERHKPTKKSGERKQREKVVVMPARKRKLRERTHDWQEIQHYTLWPEQEQYERLRPVILFGETAAERAKETGTSERTLYHQARLFEQEGMASLFHKERAPSTETGRSLPPEMRQLIVDLKAEHSGFRPHEIATICFLHFERRPSDHTVKRILADGPKPSLSGRRYPPYAQIADGYERRHTIVDLHTQGWSVKTMSDYLQTSRARVYEVLKRWVAEGYAGLDDRPSSAPHQPARKASMDAISEVRKLVRESPELGAYRVRAALEQIGIHLSQATCGRLLALNRKLYGLPAKSAGAPREHKEMPFKARFRQEIWSVDIRYIEEHNLGFPEPVYLISILENYSRACLASKISATQTGWDYLEVLFEALSAFGAPSMIVSDGGGQFRSNQAMDVYTALGMRKEQIEKRQAWQNYVESHFNTVRKMADAKFARARSWEEMTAIHRQWMYDYNVQRHFAHEKREDGCHSPAAVLGGQKGRVYPESVLSRILFATRYVRRLDKHGFLRYQDWKFYGERGLAKEKVTVWIYEGSLRVEKEAVTLSQYEVSMLNDHKHVQVVRSARAHETPFHSPQLTLFDLGPDGWILYWKTPEQVPRRNVRRVEGITQLPLFETQLLEKAVGADAGSGATRSRTHLHLLGERAQGQGIEE